MATPETKKTTVHALTLDEAFKTSKEDWRWVKIPKTNAHAETYDTIRLNHYEFKAGEKYHLPSPVADEVEAHMERYNYQIMRRNSSQRDLIALRQVGDEGYDPVTMRNVR